MDRISNVSLSFGAEPVAGGRSLLSRIRETRFPPLLAGLLQDRRTAFLLAGIGAVQLLLTAAGLPAWHCPFRAALGIPCPGCGLSRGMVFLLQGDWQAALTAHAFAPAVLFGLAFLIIAGSLPSRQREAVIGRVAEIESRYAPVPLVLVGMIACWIARIFIP
ncbi:MAG: DUF2752 domain-containing protein [Deltaproteobacteria bacterium]|nr:DUF2752 domain-containing protein [Deltaproteobacteria bacterium]